jgi:hypothetical protein
VAFSVDEDADAPTDLVRLLGERTREGRRQEFVGLTPALGESAQPVELRGLQAVRIPGERVQSDLSVG